MKTSLSFVTAFLFNCVLCFDESFDLGYNGGEISPLYGIIYSDITDILKELGVNHEAVEKANNENESNEDIEDLLSEYHHYLEKAHKQRLNYLEKNKPKNKVPIIHHEKFSKMKSPGVSKYNDFYKNNLYKLEHNYPPAFEPINMFIPFNSNTYMTSEQPSNNNDLSETKKIVFNDEPPISSFSSIPLKSTCCKGHGTPEHVQYGFEPMMDIMNSQNKALQSPEQSDDTITLKMKVDIQLPKFLSNPTQFYSPQSRDKMSDYNPIITREYLSAMKLLPPSMFDFPDSNLFGYIKNTDNNNKHDIQNPVHKITTIHKKKKSKAGNNNKKHRKKVITFHNIKIEPELSLSMLNLSVDAKNTTDNNNVTLNLPTNKTFQENVTMSMSTTAPLGIANISEFQTEENILLVVNITNNIENGTNEGHKIENSIETDSTNTISNASTEKTIHLIKKREISQKNMPTTPKTISVMPKKQSTIPSKQSTSTIKNKTLKKKSKSKFPKKNIAAKLNGHKGTKTNYTHDNLKKIDKILPTESELLYWPDTNVTKLNEVVKNITAIILEHEEKKGKLNMTSETIRRNHTRVLEQAIFGNVDWNNVDAVAPAFISFVGKYIEGILTFCNDHICHSMKCTKQNCLHRYCAPEDRYNKGHCTGSNGTDSVISMASIMDLPNKIAFEIVDILQDRMIGKLFGKITLCINTKCITFATSKKVFQKHKCVNTEKLKELDSKGHCILAKVA